VKSLGRCTLSPRNLIGKVMTFVRTRVKDAEMPSLQGVIARMLHTGVYIPGAEFVGRVQGGCLKLETCNALLRLTANPELATFDDIAEVFFDGGNVGMWVDADTMGVPPTQLEAAATAARDNPVHAAAMAAGANATPIVTPVEAMRATNLERVRRDLEVLRRGSKRKFLDGERPIVEVHFGATGSGKTRAVLEKYPDA
jgi:hypothetical protein